MAESAAVQVDDHGPGTPISPYIFGSSELGTMDGGAPSVTYDRTAGVTARRFGGNLTTGYNWVNNADHAGKDWHHANGSGLLDKLGVAKAEFSRPAAAIERMHENSLSMNAVSAVTVPLAGYVAADIDGAVAPGDAAPSSRFVPISWQPGPGVNDPVARGVVNMPQLIARLTATYGGAKSGRGIWAYILDNEPGLWAETHPRIVKAPATIRSHIERSLAAASVIKSIDPDVKIFGPSSWGVTEMVNFQNASDWQEYARYGTFLAAYLDAFRQASERAGVRLLDALDVHWYPASHDGDLFRTEDPKLAQVLLDAPRSLTEPGFKENSWVTSALPVRAGDGTGLTLPLLPSLQQIIAKWFPGTRLSVTEYNFGGAGQLASALAVADALGRFGHSGVYFAAHWGSLSGTLQQAFRLYRAPDEGGTGIYGDRALASSKVQDPSLAFHAARSDKNVQIIAINKALSDRSVVVSFQSGRERSLDSVFGFDARNPRAVELHEGHEKTGSAWTLRLPGRGARRFNFQ